MARHFFLRGQYLASIKPSFRLAHGIYTEQTGRALFCPICAEVWFHAPVDRQETYVDHVLCDKHPHTPSRKAGLLWIPWDMEWNNDLPPELLKREFLMMCEMKEIQND